MRFLVVALTLFHHSGEPHPFEAVDPATPPAAYVRDVGEWRQYWLWSPDNTQDRGIVRTGRHEGDWELVQVSDREVVVSQHAGAERCPRPERLEVYVAHGSHALYLRPGVRDRTWPDPNDEADGRGPRVTPRLVPIATQPWLRDPRPWGDSRAGWVPGEMDSPRGPAFQGVRWEDPDAFARSARPCEDCDERGECDGLEGATAAGAAAIGALGLLGWRARRARRRHGR